MQQLKDKVGNGVNGEAKTSAMGATLIEGYFAYSFLCRIRSQCGTRTRRLAPKIRRIIGQTVNAGEMQTCVYTLVGSCKIDA
eukprot:SAG31_NODE_5926_length_2254_cov_2.129002_2_plen_82_part_00